MRIISGSIKGKKLFEPKDILTRPLKDIVKESIFNLIQHSNKFNLNIQNSKVLDLFSGTGSFGLECLSRESSLVVFLENYNEALNILKKNINYCNFENRAKVIEKDIFNFDFSDLKKEKFDIIFLDPPFKKKINDLIIYIFEKNLLSENSIIIIHRHKNEKELLSKKFNILDERVYGNSKIFFGNYLSK